MRRKKRRPGACGGAAPLKNGTSTVDRCRYESECGSPAFPAWIAGLVRERRSVCFGKARTPVDSSLFQCPIPPLVPPPIDPVEEPEPVEDPSLLPLPPGIPLVPPVLPPIDPVEAPDPVADPLLLPLPLSVPVEPPVLPLVEPVEEPDPVADPAPLPLNVPVELSVLPLDPVEEEPDPVVDPPVVPPPLMVPVEPPLLPPTEPLVPPPAVWANTGADTNRRPERVQRSVFCILSSKAICFAVRLLTAPE
jgi:hypothetical protein